jgi:hypothetical protein
MRYLKPWFTRHKLLAGKFLLNSGVQVIAAFG